MAPPPLASMIGAKAWHMRARPKTLTAISCSKPARLGASSKLRPSRTPALFNSRVTSLAASVPGAGGVLSVTISLLIARAKTKFKAWAIGKSLKLLDSLLDKSFKKIWGVVFRKGGNVEGALAWLNSRLKSLDQAIDKAANLIESRRRTLLGAMR